MDKTESYYEYFVYLAIKVTQTTEEEEEEKKNERKNIIKISRRCLAPQYFRVTEKKYSFLVSIS